MAYAGYAAAKVIAERKVEGFYHDMALSAAKRHARKRTFNVEGFFGKGIIQ